MAPVSRLREPFHTSLHLSFGDDARRWSSVISLGWNEGARERMTDMPNLPLRSTSFRLFLLAGLAGLPLTLAFGHEGHHVECNETAINAVKADIQAMSDGEARTTASKEVEAAQQMMAKNDIEGCKSHIHSAMEATEK